MITTVGELYLWVKLATLVLAALVAGGVGLYQAFRLKIGSGDA